MVKNLAEVVCGGGADGRDHLPILLGRPVSPKEKYLTSLITSSSP